MRTFMKKLVMGCLGALFFLAGGFSIWKFGFHGGNGIPASPVSAEATPEPEGEAPWINEPIQPIPKQMKLDARKVALGKRLFHDVRLSGNCTVSCANCHDLKKGGTDNRARSLGINGQLSDINSPTVLNSAFNFKHFWDGRANTLEEQAEGPILNPKEMGCKWPDLLGRLAKDPGYGAAFQELYSDGISIAGVKSSLATFMRSLTTPNCRFDRFLRGESSAITESEKKGYELFKERGCVRCHQGINVGGNIFSKFGVLGDYFKDRGNVTKADLGRFNVTGKEEDRFVFKVPGLRNVTLTAPYFHDGSASTLEEAVAVMARYQLGSDIPKEDVQLIVGFLKTLTPEESRN
jgi:cytochrome c peroxidase